MESSYEWIIVGAGPGGLQLAEFLHQEGRSYVILEKASVGSNFEIYPPHGTLISINKVHTGSTNPEFNLRHDWNSLLSQAPVNESTRPTNPILFSSFSQDLFPPRTALVSYLRTFGQYHNIIRNVEVYHVCKYQDGKFAVSVRMSTGSGFKNVTISSDKLVMATGTVGPYVPRFQGVEYAIGFEDMATACGTVTCPLTRQQVPDNSMFTGKRVLVIGKSNSGFETAAAVINNAAILHLCSPNQLKHAWATHYVGNLRAINNTILDMYQLKSQVGVINGNIVRISKTKNGFKVDYDFTYTPEDPVTSFEYDYVIRATGFSYIDTSLFDEKTCPVVTCKCGRYPILNGRWEVKDCENLYVAGAAMSTCKHCAPKAELDTTGFIHGFRYSVRSMYNIARWKESKQFWSVSVPRDDLCAFIINRLAETSALWQQYGSIFDVIAITPRGIEYLYELPWKFILSQEFLSRYPHFITVKLAFGDLCGEDPFSHVLQGTPQHPEKSIFLHPVFTQYQDGKETSSLHLLEHLDSDWTHPKIHRQPLRNWLHTLLPTTATATATGSLHARL